MTLYSVIREVIPSHRGLSVLKNLYLKEILTSLHECLAGNKSELEIGLVLNVISVGCSRQGYLH